MLLIMIYDTYKSSSFCTISTKPIHILGTAGAYEFTINIFLNLGDSLYLWIKTICCIW